jgi:hypothetical protein
MSTRENAAAAMSTSEMATGAMPPKGNVAAPMSATVTTAVSATASERVSGKRKAAKRENSRQCKDRFAHHETSSTGESHPSQLSSLCCSGGSNGDCPHQSLPRGPPGGAGPAETRAICSKKLIERLPPAESLSYLHHSMTPKCNAPAGVLPRRRLISWACDNVTDDQQTRRTSVSNGLHYH